jgi:DNA polymerase-3 subunit epsilon
MKYLVIDTETSGLYNYRLPADDPSQPRVASVSFIKVGEDGEIEDSFFRLIKPDGWEMNPDATKVNGLTMDILFDGGVPILDVLGYYNKAIDEGRVVVAHNSRFDSKAMRSELRRAGLPDRFEETKTICTMRASAEVIKKKKRNGVGYVNIKLVEAHEFMFGEKSKDAWHQAENDALACLDIFRWLKARGLLPEPQVFYAKDAKNQLTESESVPI